MSFRVPDDISFTASNTPNASTAFSVAASGDTGYLSLTQALTAGLIADGDTVPYLAVAVDADGVPEGDYEAGVGTFTDATPDTLTRTTVERSTNSGAAVDFSGATAVRVSVALPTARQPRRTQYTALAASTASYDIACRGGCHYLVLMSGLDFSADQIEFNLRVSTDGTSFDATAGHYSHGDALTTTSVSGAGSTSDTEIQLTSTWIGNANAGEEVSGYLWLFDPAESGTYTRITSELVLQSYLGSAGRHHAHGQRLAAQADIAVRLFPTSGTIDAGTIAVWEYPGGTT